MDEGEKKKRRKKQQWEAGSKKPAHQPTLSTVCGWGAAGTAAAGAHTEQGKAKAYGAAGSQDALRVGLVQRQHYDVQ